jgi:hypothetical protein
MSMFDWLRDDDDAQYCSTCGKRMRRMFYRDSGYDGHTGKRVTSGVFRLACPRWSASSWGPNTHDRIDQENVP